MTYEYRKITVFSCKQPSGETDTSKILFIIITFIAVTKCIHFIQKSQTRMWQEIQSDK